VPKHITLTIHTLYQSDTVPTIDAEYIVDADWISSGPEYFGNGSIFYDQWVMDPNLYCCLVEVTDNTTDAGDKLTICFDGTETGTTTEPDGDPNPTQYDKKIGSYRTRRLCDCSMVPRRWVRLGCN
jgi:hypothetical protein